MQNDVEARRAALQAELAAIALAGGNTASVREKLAKLDAAEQETLTAESVRRQAERALHLRDAQEKGAKIGAEAAERLVATGHAVTEADEQLLVSIGRSVATADAEARLAENVHAAALYRVRQVSNRISLLEERGRALSGLRTTGQTADRDVAEAMLIEKDLQTLRELRVAAVASAAAASVPAGLQQRLKSARNELAAQEKAIAVRSLQAKVARIEEDLLAGVRELVAASGARYPGEIYRRGQALDQFLRLNVL